MNIGQKEGGREGGVGEARGSGTGTWSTATLDDRSNPSESIQLNRQFRVVSRAVQWMTDLGERPPPPAPPPSPPPPPPFNPKEIFSIPVVKLCPLNGSALTQWKIIKWEGRREKGRGGMWKWHTHTESKFEKKIYKWKDVKKKRERNERSWWMSYITVVWERKRVRPPFPVALSTLRQIHKFIKVTKFDPISPAPLELSSKKR